MYHPVALYMLAKIRIDDDLAQAERERQVRRAGSPRPAGRIDAVRFRDRLARLFGNVGPSLTGAGSANA
jgi:hypothetical protein